MIDQMYYHCLRYKNRKVRILTRDGNEYRGTLVDVDRNNVYLRPEGGSVTTSAFFGYPGFGAGLLTLSLFSLLAISLI
ncbi:LSM domain-containing protein [Paenibacillus physcomitrellae]|uniref:Cellobiose phosphorylase n=1 Tax=Paenibacillus physcomitrellae TaxID=1619311 RepID=A0ABQ1GHL1_9BACL|nr:LSM domain-containing protein [Paenibacillus physcomitrellae]GGA44060.1 hypothetical protein GCM10010917_31660 [Paenibacillus physcomitrellae]